MKNIIRKIYHILPKDVRNAISEKRSARKYDSDVSRFLKCCDLDSPTLFCALEIETINRCNGKCSFCPVNVNEKQRPYAKMSEGLFKKIVDELHELDYSGKVALFSNNEPFLDERIVNWNIYLREQLPHAFIYLYTNGTLLTLEKVKKLIPIMDKMVIDNYDGSDFSNRMAEINDWVLENHLERKIVIAKRKREEVLLSRGGQAPNKKDVVAPNTGCFHPFKQMVIRPDGKVSLCCNDALGVYTLGDVNEDSLVSIWNSGEYRKIRDSIVHNQRRDLVLCNKCDSRVYVLEHDV